MTKGLATGPGKVALATILLLFAAFPLSASAEAVTSANVSAELISETESIQPGKTFTVGIALRPADSWHTYWQNSGDSGLPTKVEWKLPDGFRAGELLWPHPVKLGKAPFVTFGYEGDALLLTEIEAPKDLRAGSEAELKAMARWLACRDDACIPGKADLTLRMRVEDSAPLPDSRWVEDFRAAKAALPQKLEGWTAKASEDGGKLRIDIVAPKQGGPSTTELEVFPLLPRILDASADASVTKKDEGYVIEVARDEKAGPLGATVPLVLVADGSWDESGRVRALRIDAVTDSAAASGSTAPAATNGSDEGAGTAPAAKAPVSPPADPVVAASSGTSAADAAMAREAAGVGDVTFLAAVGLAFLGGLILNLMPCVFPVLSLKILGFVHVAHQDGVVVRRHGYAFAAGVLLSFWILAALLLLLRAAGDSLGWGFQLQEPLFVALIVALLFLMALNLLGVFELGSSLSGAAGRFDSHSGYRGSFFSGALATVLATPCTAPFMGTALGFALVQPAYVALAVFTALGAGMAAPYLLLACVPALLARLPRPGAWMERFREAMAFPLLATVIWLLWVFGRQTGNDGVMLLLLALLLLGMGAWGSKGSHLRSPLARGVSRGFVGLSCAAALALMVSASTSSAPSEASAVLPSEDGVEWQPWDPAGVSSLRSAGRAVFVDFTADWCLSCKVNERVALSGSDFAAQLRASGVVAMKADWTRADPRITEALASFGRSGVPLYVVYPKDASKDPVVLPQVLTPAIVREALAQAAS